MPRGLANLDDAIDELLTLRHRIYSQGRDFLGVERRAQAIMAGAPAPSDAKREAQRARIYLLNALAFDVLGGVARVRGEFDPSVKHSSAAERLYRHLDADYDAERMIISNVTVAVQTDHIEQALRLLEESAPWLARSPAAETHNEIVARKADILVAIGRAADAVALHRDARLIERSEGAEDPTLTAGRLFYLARAELAAGLRSEGEESLHHGLELLANAEHTYFQIQASLTKATVLVANGDTGEAEHELQLARRQAIETGISRTEVDAALKKLNKSQ